MELNIIFWAVLIGIIWLYLVINLICETIVRVATINSCVKGIMKIEEIKENEDNIDG